MNGYCWLYSLLSYFLLGISANAQQKVTIYGYVQDQETIERVANATVTLVGTTAIVRTNGYGFFSISAQTPHQQLVVSMLGYEKQIISLHAKHDTLITIGLQTQTLEEVKITTKTDVEAETIGGFHRLSPKTIGQIPALAGEVDVLKSLQLLSGVQRGKEGTVGLNVRGGSPDQNLILLDGVPVYNINHLFGVLSIFNNDAVANVDFYKGGIPARYGGRLSSVIDVTMREGNKQKMVKKVVVSPIASRLLLEGPLIKDRSSFLLSVRRTWLDFLTTPINLLFKNDFTSVYKFYDVNFKINHTLSEKDRLYFSYYTGLDGLNNTIKMNEGTSKFNYNWGNSTFVLRWNHLYNQRLFGNLSLSYTNFKYTLENEVTDKKSFNSRFQSGISDWILKYDWDFVPTANHAIKAGVSLTSHSFKPEIQQIRTGSTDTVYKSQPTVLAAELSAYIEDELKIGKHIAANVGGYISTYHTEGVSYVNPQARLSLRYALSSHSSLKASYGNYAKYLHLLTNSSLSLPTDLWVSATKRTPPQTSTQVAVGYHQSFGDNAYNLSVEACKKTMQNVIEYQEGASFLNNASADWQDKIAIGRGEAAGVELMIQKNKGLLNGWLSYTLSRSDRVFNDLNKGLSFPYKYDSRHNLALTLNYDFRKNKSLSFNFVYGSGTPLQIALTKYAATYPHNFYRPPIPVYYSSDYEDYYGYFDDLSVLSDRNSFRTPAYHRADLSYKTTKQKKNGSRTWTLGVYNLYNRNNPFFIFYDKSVLKQFNLFPILPSFSYERSF